MSTSKNFEIAIVGGGIAGLSLAAALVHRNIPVQVYEAAHHFGEIGAGVAFTPNAQQAMQICAPGMYEACERVITHNLLPGKEQIYFDFYDGYGDGHGKAPSELLFTTTGRGGIGGVHRAHFLDELVKLVPEEIAHFGKRLDGYSRKDNGRIVMHFVDGTTAEADAVIGADGIKSKVRELIFGPEHPCVKPAFTHCIAYRGVVPMEQAIEAIGEERSKTSCIWMGSGGHVLTFPIDHGKLFNLVAFHKTYEPWTDTVHLTKPSTREDLLREFASFSDDVKQLFKLVKDNLDIWAIFDTGDHPPPRYNDGPVCIHGDAAHATSPHHGSGAGFCVEGSAIMAELLGDPRVKSAADIEKVFEVYNAARGMRTKWLVQSSRHMSDVYDWQDPVTGKDWDAIAAEIQGGRSIIGDVDVTKLVESARLYLDTKL